jgi:Bacterial Ig-like domain
MLPMRNRKKIARSPLVEPLEARQLLAAVGPDGFGYHADATAPLNYDLSEGDENVTTVLTNDDDAISAINLGADTFNFYGTNYSSLQVSTNGLIAAGTSGSSSFLNTNLTNSPTQPVIAPMWDDWTTESPASAAVLYTLEDRNNNGVPERLIIEWNNVRASQLGTDENTVTFQAILQLNTGSTPGEIIFNYVDLDAGDPFVDNGAFATVGIKDAGAQSTAPSAHRLLVSFNQSDNPLVGSGKAILITTAADTTAPQVSSAAFDPFAAKPQVSVQFSEDVGASLDASDLQLMNLTTGATVTAPAPVYDSASSTALFKFDPAALPDGNYRATVKAAGIKDASGNAMASDMTFDFFVLAGDSDHDRDVDFNDLVALAQNYGQTGKTFSQGNFNYDAGGNVDFNDLVILAQHYGTNLAPPAAGAVASTAPVTAPVTSTLLTSTKKKVEPKVFSTTPVAPPRPVAAPRRR